MPYTSREMVAKLQRGGFVIRRQSGSHAILRSAEGRRTTIAIHPGDVPEGTFRAILKQAGLTLEEFKKL